MLDFPNNPHTGDTYTGGAGSTGIWTWDGAKWASGASASSYLPLTGGSLASPGNLSVGGTLNVTGTTTLAALNGTSISLSGGLTASGNVIGNNSVQSSGVYFQNNGGWFYTPQNFVAGGAVAVSGNTGFYWTYNGGWMYSPNSVNAAGNIQANAGVIIGNSNLVFNSLGQTMYPPGDGWLYFNGSFRAADIQSNANVNAAGVVYVGGGGGPYWQNNGGWMYSPQGVWCANINTGPIQCNGNAINGVAAMYCNGSAYGGWGVQYNWINGYWAAFQCADAFYTYYNQAMQGGCYWSFCDERMKWNFRPVTRDCLAAVNAIELRGFDFSEGAPRQRRTNPKETRPEFFRWEDLPRIVKHIETGFIAQQLREIIPEAVPDPYEEGSYLSVDMRPMVATLIGAVQQLTRRLEAVEGKA